MEHFYYKPRIEVLRLVDVLIIFSLVIFFLPTEQSKENWGCDSAVKSIFPAFM